MKNYKSRNKSRKSLTRNINMLKSANNGRRLRTFRYRRLINHFNDLRDT